MRVRHASCFPLAAHARVLIVVQIRIQLDLTLNVFVALVIVGQGTQPGENSAAHVVQPLCQPRLSGQAQRHAHVAPRGMAAKTRSLPTTFCKLIRTFEALAWV